ncbi:MAG: hypothetical protein CSB23_00780 [Deltaproteobacteria bacterium]|nr:MAG: hypothetical protein CSB23_00780 [Deltaproteobacteria bacterium]
MPFEQSLSRMATCAVGGLGSSSRQPYRFSVNYCRCVQTAVPKHLQPVGSLADGAGWEINLFIK